MDLKNNKALLGRRLTEQEYENRINRTAQLVIENLIASQHALHKAEALTHTDVWFRELKNYGNKFIQRLIIQEKNFDYVDEGSENFIDLAEDFEDFMTAVNNVSYKKLKGATMILEEFNKNPEKFLSIIGDD